MGGHFACIGLDTDSEEEFGELLERLVQRSAVLPSAPNERLLRWLDASGAALFFHIGADESVDCVTPSYNSTTWVPARIRSFLEHDECRHCNPAVVEILDDTGEMSYPMVLQLENVAGAVARFAVQSRVQLRVAGFAEECQAWKTEDEFFSSQANQEIKFAAQAFVPVGQFGPHNTPHASITGIVVDSQIKRNAETGKDFWVGRVGSYGAEYEIVASVADVPTQIQSGWVVKCTCWMVGDMVPIQ